MCGICSLNSGRSFLGFAGVALRRTIDRVADSDDKELEEMPVYPQSDEEESDNETEIDGSR